MPVTTHPAIAFDDGLGKLGPLTDLRASFDIRTGARTTLERLRHELQLDVRALAVPQHLVDLTAERHQSGAGGAGIGGGGAAGAGVGGGPVVLTCGGLPWFVPGLLLVNGRCVLPLREVTRLGVGQVLIEASSSAVIAARPAIREEAEAVLCSFSPFAKAHVLGYDRPALLHRPWHVRSFLDDALSTDLVTMASHADEPELPRVTAFGDAPLSVHSTARVFPGVIFDCEHGPVVVDSHATVRPGAVIVGPAYIGPHSSVLERTLVKAHSSIGPHCKVAGEVGGVIFQGFANKAHDGHIGDAYIGEWSNLGAGTTNSNLLNTYAEVTMRADDTAPLERTGRTFMGCIIGDHVKTAICTRIMTGAVVGTGSMLAQSSAITGCVPRFTWATDDSPWPSPPSSPAGRRAFKLEKFFDVARAAMSRRKAVLSPAQHARLSALAAANG